MKKTLSILRSELQLDLRDQFSLGGSLLYAMIVSFLCLISLREIELEVWNTVYWIMVFFCSLISVAYRYQREARWHRLYYYQVMDPESLLLHKVLIQCIVSLVLSTLIFLVMSLLSFWPVHDIWRFVAVLSVGLLSLTSVLSFSSAICALVDGGAVLLALLSLPLLIPVFLLLIELSLMTMVEMDDAHFGQYFVYLVSLGGISLAAAYLMIGSIWRN